MRNTFPEESKRLLIFILIFILLGLGFLFFLLVGIPLLEKAKPVIPVTFETITSHEKEKVSIQGRFWLRSSLSSSTTCSCGGGTCSDIELIPLETEGSGWIFDDLEVNIELRSTYSAQPGHFYLPSSYTDEDFRMYTSAGQELKIDSAILVTGEVKYVYKQGEKTIVQLCPDVIEAGVRDCSQLLELDYHDPKLWGTWEFTPIDRARIIHVSSIHWDNNLPEFKFFLPAGQSASFTSGGGTVWVEQPGCSGSALTIYQNDTLREITLEEYQRYIEQKIIP
jgi:hypothetical protein